MAYTADPWLTSCQAQDTKSFLYLSAPYLVRSTTCFWISNDGSSSNSISATSGAPLPALRALLSGVYSSSPAPGFSRVTQMDGWDLLKAVTARLIPGTQAQKVILVALEPQDAPPASTEALGLALLPPVLVLAGAAPPPLLLPPQAGSRATVARAVRPA